MSSADLIRADHQTLRAITSNLREISTRSEPPPREELSAARWELFEVLITQFILKGRLVYDRLAQHPDPEIRERSRRLRAESEALYDVFATRSKDWTPDTAEAIWPEFSASLNLLTQVIDSRLAREEAELLPHIHEAPPPAGEEAEGRDWSAEEDRLRAVLGMPRRSARG